MYTVLVSELEETQQELHTGVFVVTLPTPQVVKCKTIKTRFDKNDNTRLKSGQ